VPLTAAANASRGISVTGMWPNGCPPVGAFIDQATITANSELLRVFSAK
jgi:hypothetical protein